MGFDGACRVDRVRLREDRNEGSQSDQAISHGLVVSLENEADGTDKPDDAAKLWTPELGESHNALAGEASVDQ